MFGFIAWISSMVRWYLFSGSLTSSGWRILAVNQGCSTGNSGPVIDKNPKFHFVSNMWENKVFIFEAIKRDKSLRLKQVT